MLMWPLNLVSRVALIFLQIQVSQNELYGTGFFLLLLTWYLQVLIRNCCVCPLHNPVSSKEQL